jgi:outer membrane immunogenic protein
MKLPGNLGLRATSFRYFSTGVAALGVLAFSAQANAADIYAPGAPAPFPVAAPVPLWSGLYGGVHVGGAWADLKTTDLDGYWYRDALAATPAAPILFFPPLSPLLTATPFAFRGRQTDQSTSGVFGGGTIGYNMQRGGLVFGIEADFGAMGLNSSQVLNHVPVNIPFLGTPAYNETARANISTGFYGDLTGRIGWAWGPWMFYGKGGLAVLDAKTNVTDAVYPVAGFLGGYTNFATVGGNDESRVGWTAGGGFEYLWNQTWSVKVEYQHFDFGTASSSLTAGTYVTAFPAVPILTATGPNYNFSHDLTVDTVKVGLNYHLGCCDTPLVPLK